MLSRRLREAAMALGLAVLVATGGALLGISQTGQVRVVADGDSPEAQAVKWAVVRHLLAAADGDAGLLVEQARENPEGVLREAEAAVQAAHARGLGPAAGVALEHRERLPLRVGPLQMSVPVAHPHTALVLGSGAGENWWCLVFNYLCVASSAAVPAEESAAVEAVMVPGSDEDVGQGPAPPAAPGEEAPAAGAEPAGGGADGAAEAPHGPGDTPEGQAAGQTPSGTGDAPAEPGDDGETAMDAGGEGAVTTAEEPPAPRLAIWEWLTRWRGADRAATAGAVPAP